MTEFNYTKEYDVSSSLVEAVYLNENENYVVLDLNDEFYKYVDVPAEDVVALVEANSVGAHYNTVFKHAHGPAEYLGSYWEVDEVYVPRTTSGGVAKDLTDATKVEPTKEFSLQTPVVEGSDEEPTKEFSLQTPASDKVTTDVVSDTTTLYFTLDGGDKVYEFTHNGTLDEAADELNTVVSRVGAKGRLVKAVVEFA